MPTFLTPCVSVMYLQPAIQVYQCLFNPIQRIGSLQPAPTGVLELASFPHVYFDLVYFFLELEEEARGFTVAHDLSGERQITDMFKYGFETIKVVSAELETPEVILSVPWALSLIVVRDSVQWSSIL